MKFPFLLSLHPGSGASPGPVSAIVQAAEPADPAVVNTPAARSWAALEVSYNPDYKYNIIYIYMYT